MDGIDMRRYLYFLLALLLMNCNGIGSSQQTCDQIAGLTLRSFLFKQTTPEQLRSAIAQTYHLPAESVSAQSARGEWVFDWNQDGLFYTIETKGGIPSRASVVYEQRTPSADEVTKCLGAPSRYKAWYTRGVPGRELDIDILFANQGILATGAEFPNSNSNQPPPVGGNISLSGFAYVQPGSDEEVLRRVLNPELVNVDKAVQEDFKPWPGTWKDIVVQIDPDLRSK
jgi:hypothetical protein